VSVTPVAPAEVGPMISGFTVEMAVENTLRDWFTAYLCEAERQHGLEAGQIAWPRGWAHSGSDLEKMAQDQLPCFVIMSGGITNPPMVSAMPVNVGSSIALPVGNMTAVYGVEVASVHNAAYDRMSRRNAQLYAVAVARCLLQRPLRGLASTVRQRGESYDELDFERTRTYSASTASFDITVEATGWTDGGPPPEATPPGDPTQPFPPWPTVETTEVDVIKRPIDGPITPEEAEQ
jgi:hypothetical protein